jgi:hypothetical protein
MTTCLDQVLSGAFFHKPRQATRQEAYSMLGYVLSKLDRVELNLALQFPGKQRMRPRQAELRASDMSETARRVPLRSTLGLGGEVVPG